MNSGTALPRWSLYWRCVLCAVQTGFLNNTWRSLGLEMSANCSGSLLETTQTWPSNVANEPRYHDPSWAPVVIVNILLAAEDWRTTFIGFASSCCVMWLLSNYPRGVVVSSRIFSRPFIGDHTLHFLRVSSTQSTLDCVGSVTQAQ
jgi:hypothetical protein